MTSPRKIMVIGANCFSGQDFIDLLLGDPHNEVIGVSRSEERSELFLSYKLRINLSQYRYVKINYNLDMPKLLALLDHEKPHFVVNFAALSEVGPSWESPEDWLSTNCVGLAKLINYLRKQTWLEKYLHISSPEVYGTCSGDITESAVLNPSTPYAVSKAAADMLLTAYHRQYGLPVVTVRATNVYGPRQQLHKIIPRTFIFSKLGRMIELHGGGTAIKSFIHIRDISKGELAILEQGTIGKTYHLSPESGISVIDLVKTICKKQGIPFEQVTRMVSDRPGQDAAYVINSSLARQELGWSQKISLDEGLHLVADWIEQYWHIIQNESLHYHHIP
jgi:dTDP-glucose 4,6-dehydratase